MKRLRTTLAVAALAATALAAPASAAVQDSSPATRAIARTQTPRAAAIRTAPRAKVGTHGLWCYGTEVRRCIWVEHDATHHRFRAYAGIRDKRGGDNYTVKATGIHLRMKPSYDSSKLRNWGRVNWDYDGWHPNVDHARGWWVHCRAGKYYDVQASVHFSWFGHSRGGYWDTSGYVQYLRC